MNYIVQFNFPTYKAIYFGIIQDFNRPSAL